MASWFRLLLAVLGVSAGPSVAADIEGVSFVARADAPGVMIRIHASAPVERYTVEPRDGRVEVTLYGAHVAAHVRQDRAAPPVRRYTMAGQGDRVTLRLDVAEAVEAVAYREARSHDLVVTLTRADGPRVAPPANAVVDVAPSPSSTVSRPSRTVSWGGVARPEAPSATPVPSTPAASAPTWGASAAEPARPAVRPSPAPAAPRRVAPTPRRPRPEPPAPSPTRNPLPPVAARPSPPVPDATPSPVAQPTPEERPAPRPTPRSAPPPTAPADDAPAVPVPASDAWRLDTIVLDAGHGDHDIGATYNGVREKDVTLAITRRLGQMIERELGIRVVYTRQGDQFHELRERGRIANRAGGKLFVSVHANAAGSPSARGTETYFLAPHRTESAADVMERENSVIALESDPSLYAEFSNQDAIVQAMAMSAFQEESQTLAALIEGEFRGSGRHSRGVKQAGFLVLWAASMPAVLVETGFLSNPDEARYLSSAAGQEETARAIFRSIAAYRAQYERGTRLAARP